MDKRDIDKLRELLNEELDHSNGQHLAQQLADAEAWSAWTSERANSYKRILSEKRGQYTYKDLSNKDTVEIVKARADRLVAEDQQKYDDYKELLEIIRDRISLGQSFLRNIRAEVEAGVRLT